jgi:hypothetical protein
LGRQIIKISYVGFNEIILPNVVINTGRDATIEVELEENLSLSEITVRAQRPSTAIEKGITTVSAFTFDIEDTKRFAGSRNDPARMASNFAGVAASDDSRNDIVIRGNSPSGLLWRLEGIDIPNPNHFGAMGATGGPVAMLNNNVLSRSSFLTSAFPAMYGNATSGVFDLQMRSGNKYKREHMIQTGINGLEFGAEGPFKKNGSATYLINYRYSILDIMQKIGVNFGTGSAIPQYQDLSLKIDFETKNVGKFSIFSLAGNSNINLTSGGKSLYNNISESTDFATKTAVTGISNTYYLKPTSYLKTTFAITNIGVKTKVDKAEKNNELSAYYRDNSSQTRMVAHSFLNNKLNAKQTFTIGTINSIIYLSLTDSVLNKKSENFKIIRNTADKVYLHQSYTNFQQRFNDKLTLNTGIYFQYFNLNNSASVEPRLGIKYALGRSALNFGMGQHSQLQNIAVYYNQSKVGDQTIYSNQNLNFTKSNQLALGFETSLGKAVHFKTETYYQSLNNIPVQIKPSSYSLINEGTNFESTSALNLTNKGTGNNYGVEFTLERPFINGFYFLSNLSLFSSKYKGSDGIERSTIFDSKYIANLLAGYEVKIGAKSVFTIDLKVTSAGGRRYTPIDLDASIKANETVYTDKINQGKLKDYFRTDLKFTFKINNKKVSQEWFLDIQNITNVQNIYTQSFNKNLGKIQNTYALGLLPMFNYRLYF